jgi:hypothetical protein
MKMSIHPDPKSPTFTPILIVVRMPVRYPGSVLLPACSAYLRQFDLPDRAAILINNRLMVRGSYQPER